MIIFASFLLITRFVLKRLTCILIIPLILLHSCAVVFMMAAFYGNRGYIAKNVCENRDTPRAPLCGGKCFLMTKLRKEQEREKKNPELKLKDFQLACRFTDFKMLKQATFTLATKATFFEGCIHYHAPNLSTIFHPPLS